VIYRQAKTGIGMLMLFIVVLLIAAIAAGVMITTSNTYSEKTLTVARDATAESGIILELLEVYGTDGRESSIELIYILLKNGPDSPSVALSNMMVSISSPNASQEYAFLETIDCQDNNTFVLGNFGIRHMRMGERNLEHRLSKGDVVQLCLNTPRPLEPSEEIKINIIPLKGTPLYYEQRMPDVIYREKVLLYP